MTTTRPKVGLLREIAVLIGVLVALTACRDDDRVVVPNRVLDRPLDVVLGCVRVREDGRVETLSLNLCASATPQRDCGAVNVPQLVGFVANSERNEVAMFRRCDVNGLVDLDKEAPGYNFVPVGQLPSHITATDLACKVVTANAGSCDLSVIDGRQLAAYAVERAPEDPPSSLVATIVPRLSNGEPLGARPGDILAVPARLSQAEPVMTENLMLGDEGDGVFGGLPPGTDSGDGGDESTGGDDGAMLGEFSLCSDDVPASVYVTFPSCHLVAEVSLTSQRILQSRQFLVQDDGSVLVVDSGTDPVCPVDCPAQFDGYPERELPFDPSGPGFFPMTLELVERIPEEDAAAGTPDAEVSYTALFVGGTGSDVLVELGYEPDPDPARDETGVWVPAEESLQLTLENAQGIHGIRATPAMTIDGGFHQFLYVVAGDGSTHVVDRDFDPSRLGVECDTQIDPNEAPATACHPIDPNPFGNAPDRRPFAAGPGIRPSLGIINDWVFFRVDPPPEQELGGTRAPFDRPGVVGVGVTSHGRIVYATFGQYLDAGSRVESLDPVGVMNVEVRPHYMWPQVDPHSGDPSALPRVNDEEPRRAQPGPAGSSQSLAPALRRIDLAYAGNVEGGSVSLQRTLIAERLGVPTDSGDFDTPDNVDQLGSLNPDAGRLYSKDVARVAVRDWRQWIAQDWSLIWEGESSAIRRAGKGGRASRSPPEARRPTTPGSSTRARRFATTGCSRATSW